MNLLLVLMFPLAEIAVFILVGKAIGVIPTLALIVASSALGLTMLRDAGMLTALRLQRRAENQAAILAEGGARMAAGLLLLIPGFLTDLLALGVLAPSVRRFLFSRFASGMPRNARRPGAAVPPGSRRIIDVDFRRVED